MVQEEALFDAFMKQAEEDVERERIAFEAALIPHLLHVPQELRSSYLSCQSMAFCINRRHALVRGAWLALSALPFSHATGVRAADGGWIPATSHVQRPFARLLELLLERANQISHELDGMTMLVFRA